MDRGVDAHEQVRERCLGHIREIKKGYQPIYYSILFIEA